MKLKKLEIIGFKSFANRTSFEFDDGVTCIVGPNGCGKSNVLDATKWVLGTLSSKSMRADELLDIIFNGAQGVPPMGFAQATLTFDNTDRSIQLDYNEIMITRKVYRSGESEFFINNNPCRLKDIRDLLYNTGISADSYCTIEQGKIDGIISSTPKERRFIFDELAGITKYKSRINESKARLDKVSQDLLRLQDVMKEVVSQLHSIRIQAGRAKKYAALTEELKQKKTLLYQVDLTKYSNELKSLTETIESLKTEIDSTAETLKEKKSSHSELDQYRQELEKRCSGFEYETQQIKNEITYLNQLGSNLREQLNELTKEKKDKITEKAQIENKTQKIITTCASCQDELVSVKSKRENLSQQDQTLTKHIQEAEAEIKSLAAESEKKKAELVETERKLSSYKNDRANAENELKLSSTEVDRLVKRLTNIKNDHEQALKSKIELANNKKRLGEEIEKLMAHKEILEQRQSELKTRCSSLDEEISATTSESQKKQGLKQALEELENKHEGVSKTARKLLQERYSGVLGIAADFIDVDPRYAAVIDQCLDNQQGYVIVNNAKTAFDLLQSCKDEGVGIILVDESQYQCQDIKLKGVIGSADKLVNIKEYPKTIGRILSQYVVINDTSMAIDITGSHLINKTMVTLDGVKITQNIISQRGSGLQEGIISRRAKLRYLDAEVASLASKLIEKQQLLDESVSKVKALISEFDTIRQKIYQSHVELREIEDKLDEVTQEEKVLSDELSTNQMESDQLKQNAGVLGESIQRFSQLVTELVLLRDKLGASVQDMTIKEKEYSKERESMIDSQKTVQVELAKLEEKEKNLTSKISESQAQIEALKKEHEKTLVALQDIALKMNTITESHGNYATDIEKKNEMLSSLNTKKENSIAELESKRNEIAKQKTEVEDLESTFRTATNRIKEHEMKFAEVSTRLQTLKDQVANEIGMPVKTAESVSENREALESEIKTISERVATFGAVNMLAIEKLNELEERDSVLHSQEKDLITTKLELEEFIDKVNHQSLELFQKTIEAVREHFNNIFRKVFNGGKADIIIEKDDGDSLEYGVEIVARLPKKEITKLSLMSGGEKALTALSLTLALFKTRPAGFCFLDEVDAALDESNIDKFVNILLEFSKETQFIVVTHNKRTMTAGTKMYGISMQPVGVSRRVAVDFQKEEVAQKAA